MARVTCAAAAARPGWTRTGSSGSRLSPPPPPCPPPAASEAPRARGRACTDVVGAGTWARPSLRPPCAAMDRRPQRWTTSAALRPTPLLSCACVYKKHTFEATVADQLRCLACVLLFVFKNRSKHTVSHPWNRSRRLKPRPYRRWQLLQDLLQQHHKENDTIRKTIRLERSI